MLKLLKYLKKYILMIIIVIVTTSMNVASQLYLPTLMGNIVDRGIIKGDIGLIVEVGKVMFLVSLLGTLAMIVSAYFSSRISTMYSRDLKNTVYEKVQTFSPVELSHLGIPSLITRTTNDIAQVERAILMGLRMLIRAPFMLVGGLILVFNKNFELAKVFFISTPILVLTIFLIGKKAFPLFTQLQGKIDKFNRVIRESLTGIRVIRSFNKVEYEKNRFRETSLELRNTAYDIGKIMAITFPLLNIILNFTIVGVMWYGSRLIEVGSLEIGQLMAFIQYVMQIMFSVVMLAYVLIMIPRASASGKRINEVLSIDIDHSDGDLELGKVKGEIHFKDVAFKYRGAQGQVLKNIDFTAKSGETTAIIGGTGSGKTTLINLICRFYDASSGKILIDGIDIRDIKKSSIRDNIGLSSQTPSIFKGSLRDNIVFKRDKIREEDVIKACEIAEAWDFISKLDGQLDYEASQKGKNLSGGQKQRISIARALVKEKSIYIFDDSFSALDYSTDRRVRENIRRALKDKTILIVAQRIASIVEADKILVLDNGSIVGQGSHQDLLENCQVYREIAKSQNYLSKGENYG